MYPIDPGDEWGAYVVIGGLQTKDYEPLYARIHPDGPTVTRWRLTDADRAHFAQGGDLFLSVIQAGQPFQPVNFWTEGKVAP